MLPVSVGLAGPAGELLLGTQIGLYSPVINKIGLYSPVINKIGLYSPVINKKYWTNVWKKKNCMKNFANPRKHF